MRARRAGRDPADGHEAVLVVGPYGGCNLGDDAIARSLTTRVHAWGWRVGLTLLETGSEVGEDADCPEIYPRQRAFRWGALRRLGRYRGVLIGGGQQLQEPRLPNPLWGHLATVWQFSVLARRQGCRLALVDVGSDGHFSAIGRWMLRGILHRCDYASVRDAASAAVLKAHGGRSVRVGADPVFSWSPGVGTLNPEGTSGTPRGVLWILSNDKFHDLGYLRAVREAVDALDAAGVRSRFALSDLQPTYDGVLPTRPELQFEGEPRWLGNGGRSVSELVRQIGGVDCVISSRMHALILAAIQGVPFVALCRAGKMDALMDRLGVPAAFRTRIDGVAGSWLRDAVLGALREQRQIRASLEVGVAELRREASADLERVRECLTVGRVGRGVEVEVGAT